ncbi:btb poz domain containing protein [Rutstroemia sp. NJR-2017a WRK4]|nr:btb poz domain containing protein [Rutstroemia sp. NJR-2017a WRK4]
MPPTREQPHGPGNLQKKKAPSLLNPQNEMVTIHVTDADGKVFNFVLHKSFLCYASPFFDAAFNGNFVEGQTQSMKLETSEQAFGMLVDSEDNYNSSCCPNDEDGDPPPEHVNHLIELWILADKILMPTLQNMVMDQIYTISWLLFDQCGLDVQAINFNLVYNNTTTESPLRALVVSIFNVCSYALDLEFMAHLPREMVLELYMDLWQVHGKAHFYGISMAGLHVSTQIPTRGGVKTK